MKKTLLMLAAIIVIAIGFRFYKLGEVPISPDWDEAALGYNAYSILKTGRDEYGAFLPLTLRSFDDYKPALYAYLAIPSVALFGLSLWSTRLPSAVMGIVGVLGTYFLVIELFRLRAAFDKEKKKITVWEYKFGTLDFPNLTALLASFLMAISPWSIQLSRAAFETNTGDTICILSVAAFLAGLRNKMWLPISALLFGIGLYSYQSERVFVPLLIIFLAVTQWKRIFKKENTGAVIVSIIIGLIFVVPLFPILFGTNGLMRLKATSNFTDTTNLLSTDIQKLELDQKSHDILGLALDNRRIVYVKTVIAGYLSHYSLEWLFLIGDNPRHHAPDMGLMYLWELPFLLYGLYWTWKHTKGPMRTILFGWFLLAPVPAAPTTGLPHALRTFNFLPTFQIFTAAGIVGMISGIYQKVTGRKNNNLRYLIYAVGALYLLFILFNIAYYCDRYFVQQNPESSQYWQYGYKESVALTEKLKGKYQKVMVSTKLDQSYMFFLFYTKYDPSTYQAHGGTVSGGFAEAHNSFDKYEFRSLDWSKEKRDGTILYVGDPSEMPHGNVANINFLNGTPAIVMADQPNGAP